MDNNDDGNERYHHHHHYNKLHDVARRLDGCRAVNRGLTIVITGANSGIGLAAAKLLCWDNPNHRIVLVARTLEKAQMAKDEVVRCRRYRVVGAHHSAPASAAAAPPHVPDNYENHPHDNDRQQRNQQQMNDGQHPPNDVHNNHLIALECDQSCLASVRQFCERLQQALDDTYRPDLWSHRGIDVLCLNAAVLLPETSEAHPTFTGDNIETTFQTNYLAPFLMVNLLHKSMNPNGRVVFTTSGLHLQCSALDVSGGYDSVTRHVRPKFGMVDGSPYHYKRAYTLSKLCNVALCHELHRLQQQKRQLPSNQNITYICFSPGLMLGSGLFRHQDIRVVEQHLANTKCMQQAKTVEWGAGALVYVALSDTAGQRPNVYWSDESLAGCSATYGNEFSPHPLTDAVLDDSRRKELWDLSVQLVQLKPSEDLSRL